MFWGKVITGMCARSEVWGVGVMHTMFQSEGDAGAAPGPKFKVGLLLHQMVASGFKYRTMFVI